MGARGYVGGSWKRVEAGIEWEMLKWSNWDHR
jgi:hypothetical protein